jgi:DNA polymerase-1
VWLNAYRTGQDIYMATAEAVWGEIPDGQRPARRQLAKTVVLASLYGAGANKIAQTAGIPFEEAVALIEAFWGALPQLRAYMDSNIDYARQHGCVWTMGKLRRRHLPDMNHRWSGRKKAAENQAGNTPVQGTAADILKMAMVVIQQRDLIDKDCRLLLQVHDELVFEVRESEVGERSVLLCAAMEEAVTLSVPLKVEAAIGDNWAEAH